MYIANVKLKFNTMFNENQIINYESPYKWFIIKQGSQFSIVKVSLPQVNEFIQLYEKNIQCSGSTLSQLLQTFAGVV